MKKNTFVEGAMISTIGIVLCKILGILYVIPFRAIIGTKGAILYSYAYTIYSVFASLSSTGIPSAMAKTVSEYNTLEYYNSQERAYKICKNIIVILGLISFLVLFIFAPSISYLIIGDLEGGNTLSDITFVIRVISTALLFIPILSVSKGYLQGHRMMQVPAKANVIEQLVRVLVIILGSFIVLRLLNLSVTIAVGVATFGATVGAIIAYLYISKKIKTNNKDLKRNEKAKEEELKISNKMIFKRILIYSLPFILIEFIRSIYNTVDTFTVVKGLVNLGYSINDAENVLSIITTWGSKLNMIVLSVTFGLTMSIIPNVVSSATLKNYKDVSLKINQALKIILFTTLPMTLGLFFLSGSVWTLFYGYDVFSAKVFSIFVFQTIINSFFYILVDTTNALDNPKVALTSLLGSFILKAILNIPMMNLLSFLGIDAYYGAIFTTMLVQGISVMYLLYKLKKSYKVSYKETLKPFIKIILISFIMLVSLMILRLFIGDISYRRIYSFLEILLYAFIGGTIYIVLSIKNNVVVDVFGKEFVNKIMKKFKK